MKKFLTSILVAMAVIFPSFANQPSDDEEESDEIGLEYTEIKDGTDGRNRAPQRYNISAHYYGESQSILIYTASAIEGEVNLYLDDCLIDYSPSVNTCFQLQSEGFYKIEIVTDYWIATGYLKL